MHGWCAMPKISTTSTQKSQVSFSVLFYAIVGGGVQKHRLRLLCFSRSLRWITQIGIGIGILFSRVAQAQTPSEYSLDLPTLESSPSLQKLQQQAQDWYQTAKSGRKELAKRRLDGLFQLMRDRGISNMIAVSHVLLALGDRQLRRGRYEEARDDYEQAKRFAPILAAPDYRLAWLSLQTQMSAPQHAIQFFGNAVRKEWEDPFQRAYVLRQALMFVCLGLGLLFLLWWLFLLIRSLRTLDFDFREMFPTGVTLQQLRIFTIFLLLMPILMGGGIIEVLLVWVAFSWFYQTMAERVLSTIGMIFLSLFPQAFLWIGHLGALSGSQIETVYLLNEADPPTHLVSRAEEALSRSPRSVDLLWSLGNYAKRNGEIQKARAYYMRAWSFEKAAGLTLNLGNLDFYEREGDKAYKRYHSILNDRAAQPQVYYNIGQLMKYSKNMQTLQQGAEYRSAAILGRGGRIADDFNKLMRPQINRYVMESTFPIERYERAVFSPRDTPFSRQMWSLLARWIPYDLADWSGVAWAALLWLLLPIGRLFRRGDSCKKCGVIKLLSETQDERQIDLPPNAVICGRCIRSFASSEEGAPRRRVQKELAAGRWQARRALLERILSALTLGGGHVLQERSLKGFFFFFLLSFYAAWWWFSLSPWPHPLSLEMESTWWPQIGAGGILLLCWFYVQRDLGRYKR